MAKQRAEMKRVTVELPQKLMQFLHTVEPEPCKYLEESIVQIVRADIDAGVWSPEEIIPTSERKKQRYREAS